MRRIEILVDLQDKHNLEPLGPADGPVKNAIFGINAPGQYGIELDSNDCPTQNYKDAEFSRSPFERVGRWERRPDLLSEYLLDPDRQLNTEIRTIDGSIVQNDDTCFLMRFVGFQMHGTQTA